MDLADEKVDDALRHTEHVHRLVASNRDLELSELRKVVAEKEQAIDELRETLACTKRSFEARVRQLQDAVHCRDSQVRPRLRPFISICMIMLDECYIGVLMHCRWRAWLPK